MLYSASSCLSPAARACRSFWTSVSSAMARLPDQEPDQRQPQLARVRLGTIVDQHLGRIEAADDGEQIAERLRIFGTEAGAVAQPRAFAECSIFRRRARHHHGPIV